MKAWPPSVARPFCMYSDLGRLTSRYRRRAPKLSPTPKSLPASDLGVRPLIHTSSSHRLEDTMSELVADCPRCAATKITFDLTASTRVGQQHGWQNWHEAFCVCRHCHRATIFVLSENGIDQSRVVAEKGLSKLPSSANNFVRVERYVTARDRATTPPPEHIPESIKLAFIEGAKCLSSECYNAAGTMFRLCVDHATTALLPEANEDGLTPAVRRSLGLRLQWLLANGRIPAALRDLSHAVKEDGNDGAHAGLLTVQDAEDLLDFTVALLERLYTEPKRLELAVARRAARRAAA